MPKNEFGKNDKRKVNREKQVQELDGEDMDEV